MDNWQNNLLREHIKSSRAISLDNRTYAMLQRLVNAVDHTLFNEDDGYYHLQIDHQPAHIPAEATEISRRKPWTDFADIMSTHSVLDERLPQHRTRIFTKSEGDSVGVYIRVSIQEKERLKRALQEKAFPPARSLFSRN